jgi:tRNA A-37 threonylcarbamoyl transferase component Bud32/predicted nucleotidyltransferase
MESSSLSSKESNSIKKYMDKLGKNRKLAGVCLYGSKVAGYGRPNSDIDIMIVLEDYPYAIKYSYVKEGDAKISALIVDHKALEKDADGAFLGEFVVGRLLHIYESIFNPSLFNSIEILYKKRVILEEILDIVKTTNILCTEISFPLEFIAFSKIKRRSSLYPAAMYSYYNMYTGQHSVRNLDFALQGYQKALKEILSHDSELLITKPSLTTDLLQISGKRVVVHKKEEKRTITLKLVKKLQIFSSYFIHAYAGRRVLHYAMREAESKIMRHKTYSISLPEFMISPREYYWKLPEGIIISGSKKNWLDVIAKSVGLRSSYLISNKRRLGNINSKTMSYTLTDPYDSNYSKTIVAKKYAKIKGVKWAALNIWTSNTRALLKHPFKVDPLFRLGTEYKALRHLRQHIGLRTPIVKAVSLELRLLVTEFIEGKSIAHIFKNSLEKNSLDDINLIHSTAKQIAKVHSNGCTLGNIKPKNVIINNSDRSVFFTDLEQFNFNNADGDPIWDIIQFLCWGLKRTRNVIIAKEMTREFFNGYFCCTEITTTKDQIQQQLSKKSTNYIEYFYPLVSTSVARTIKGEIKNLSNQI